MWARSAVRSSASETAPAFLLFILNVTCPAGIWAGRGAQPCGVRSIVTAASRAGPAELRAVWEPAQPAAASASTAAAAVIPVRRGGHPARLPSVLNVEAPYRFARAGLA